jgi:hypothetical protein
LTLTVDLLSRIAEWKPVKMSRTYALYWGVLGVGSLVILRSVVTRWLRGELRERAGVYATDLLLFAGFSFLPLRGVRHIAWILFLMPAILGHHMLVAPAGKDGRSLLRAVLAATAVAVAVLLGPVKFASRADHGVGLREDWYPVEACDFMEEAGLVDLRFYNSYEWGGYLIWRWGPEHKVFIDGRCLVYGDEMLEETFAVSDGESNWRDVLDRWKVQSIIMRYSAYDSKHFFQEPGWPCVHWDDTALVMLEPEELAARDLPGLELSNPVTFDWAGGPGDAEAAIDEIDVVLQRDPKCWTALAEKARCLVVLAEEGDRATRLERADVLARAAVRLSRRKHSAPWLATYYVALALGEEQRAEHARRRAEATRERWLSADEIRNRLGPGGEGDVTEEEPDGPPANSP